MKMPNYHALQSLIKKHHLTIEEIEKATCSTKSAIYGWLRSRTSYTCRNIPDRKLELLKKYIKENKIDQ